MLKFYAISILALTLSTSAFCQQFICVAEKATGFAYSNSKNEWVTTPFKVDKKFILAKNKEQTTDGPIYSLKVLGEDLVSAECDRDFTALGYISCGGFGLNFKFNKENGRYLLTNTVGYVSVLPSKNKITDETSDTPFIEIGKCSSF